MSDVENSSAEPMEEFTHVKRHIFKKVHYALLLIRKGGLGLFLRQFWWRLFSKTHYIWYSKDLEFSVESNASAVQYTLHPASNAAIRKMVDYFDELNGQDVFEILRRLSYYDRGFDSCYLALTDSGNICHIAWLLTAKHNDLIQTNYPPGMRLLKENEAMVENVFTFSRYKSKGIMASVISDLLQIAKNNGIRRVLAYVDNENTISQRCLLSAGFRPYDEEREIRRCFKIWRQDAR
jgi:hypothetical protein